MNPFSAALRYRRAKREWLGAGGLPVSQTLADSRAAVCKTCPKNQPHPIYQNLAAPVALQLRRQIEAKAQMKLAVNGESDLHICEVCWCVLSLKVWAPIQVASKGLDLATLPDFCWIRKELGK